MVERYDPLRLAHQEKNRIKLLSLVLHMRLQFIQFSLIHCFV